MNDDKELKEIVKEKYGNIAVLGTSCCGTDSAASTCCGPKEESYFVVMKDDYANIKGYAPEADLQLGCGVPTSYAGIKEGDTVVDLGSGAGNDVFVARSIVGEKGKVIGIDITPQMIEKANVNNSKLGYKNIEFILSDIEDMKIADNTADVVISNCVLNLVPDKQKAFAEMYRVIKPGGHFCVSDIVLKGQLPKQFQKSAEMYVGCVTGAIEQDEYINGIKACGFSDIEIKKSKVIDLPDELLEKYLSKEEITEYKNSTTGIYSITVVGYKK